MTDSDHTLAFDPLENLFDLPYPDDEPVDWQKRWVKTLNWFEYDTNSMAQMVEMAAILAIWMHRDRPLPKRVFDAHGKFYVEILAGCTLATSYRVTDLMTDIAVFQTCGRDGDQLFEKIMTTCLASSFCRFGLWKEFPVDRQMARFPLYWSLCRSMSRADGRLSDPWFIKKMFPYFKDTPWADKSRFVSRVPPTPAFVLELHKYASKAAK
jgi:hypothetical protein